MDFKLPSVGENVVSGTVVKLLVNKGDSIKKGQDLLELETEKASLPVPSPYDGVITDILIEEGQDVKIGSVIMKIDAQPSPESGTVQAAEAKKQQESSSASAPATQAPHKEAQPYQSPSQTIEPTPHRTDGEVDPSSINLAVIGAGPGGYAAAFLAADMGMKVTMIDKEKNPGGVCLYRGCIPSKALLHAAKVLAEAREAKEIGLDFGEPKIDIERLRAWKNEVVEQLTGGTGQLRKQRKINAIQGTATFVNSNTLKVKKVDGGEEELSFDRIILATGSRPATIPNLPPSKHILDSTTALDIETIPERLLVVGGGYIGLELGTVYNEIGSKVSVVEMLPQLLTGADRDMANILIKRIEARFDKIMTSTKVLKMEETGNGIKVDFEDKDGKKFSEEYGKVLISIGRKPNTENLGLENTKVQIIDRGFIKVNAQLETDDPVISAIGDIAGNPMLAHKASAEGRVAVEAIAGHKVAFEPSAIPAVVFTDPEVAWCGVTEIEAKERGLDVQVVKFPWAASGRAITVGRTDGLTKLIIDSKTERVLGMGIVGVGAGELISEGVLAVEMGAVATDIKLSIHPHPTTSETVMESAEGFFGTSTHVYRPKRK